jgi:hypothetical protein
VINFRNNLRRGGGKYSKGPSPARERKPFRITEESPSKSFTKGSPGCDSGQLLPEKKVKAKPVECYKPYKVRQELAVKVLPPLRGLKSPTIEPTSLREDAPLFGHAKKLIMRRGKMIAHSRDKSDPEANVKFNMPKTFD